MPETSMTSYVKAMSEQKTIFSIEEKAFQQAETVLKGAHYQTDPLRPEFDALFNSYARMFRQFRQLIELSDGQQLNLKQAYEQIEAQQRQLTTQNEQLVEAERLREDVERIIQHDLKTPLSTIIGFPSLIRERGHVTDADIKDLMLMKEAGLKMLQIINRSFDLFKIERGMYQTRPAAVNIGQILRDIAVEAEALQQGKRLAFRLLRDGKPAGAAEQVWVAGEELLCYSILTNVIQNALEASPTGEVVTAAMTVEGADVVLRIHNRGVVPAVIRARFFEKYMTAGKTHGTGLGTYIAKRFTEVQHGSIAMTTSEAEGTTVSIRLPQALPPGSTEAGKPSGQDAHPLFLSAESLAALPPEWVAALQAAVTRLDLAAVNRMIEQMRDSYAPIAEELARLIKNFQFDVLQALFEQEDEPETASSKPAAEQ